ncbi:MAG TPA: right-handed parallel beta-helix repeat-containing protein [Solirubrobacterales bacterium]|nr:right-handed parallel beta-helix repeat-containing protein [Solirubrobacterales bacterium]
MLPISRTIQSRRAAVPLASAIALVALGVLASLAFGRGPLHAFVGKADEVHARAKSGGGRINIDEATAVSPLRTSGTRSTETSGTSGTRKAPSPGGDATAPETTIFSGPAALTALTSASFGFSSNESGVTFGCKIDSGRWNRCRAPKAYTGLLTGSHQFAVRATDKAGNVDTTPATWSWTIAVPPPPPMEEPPVEETPPPVEEPPADTTPPDTSIQSGPSGTTTATSAAFAFSTTEAGASFECKLDGGSFASCVSPKSYSGLAVGSHAFSVRAKDVAGNVDSTPASRSWTVEAETAPPPPPPPPPDETCDTTVSSVSAAQSSVAGAAAGSVVCLADGSYGKVSLEANKAAPGVTLRAAHPGKATIAGASLQGSNLTLARFVSTSSVTIQPGAKGMTVEHNRVTGGGQGIDGCPSSTTTCDDTKIIGNELIGPFGEDAIHLNRYHDANGDGVGILVEGNEITNVRENGNHSDCLQTVWVGDHIVFRRNYLHDNRCQGFFVKDQASLGGVSGPINGITVEDNLFLRNEEPCGPPLTSCGQPMYFQVFGPYSAFKMKRNTIWGDGYDSIAAFRESTGADTQIANNVIYRLWTDTNMSGISLSENTHCVREGSWPSSRPGETMACSLSFANPSADDYRIPGSNRGVDWAPAEVHYGP